MQVPKLRSLQKQAEANGVSDTCLLDAAACKAKEPEVHALAALWSPSSGIIDSHALMAALQGDAEAVRSCAPVRIGVL